MSTPAHLNDDDAGNKDVSDADIAQILLRQNNQSPKPERFGNRFIRVLRITVEQLEHAFREHVITWGNLEPFARRWKIVRFHFDDRHSAILATGGTSPVPGFRPFVDGNQTSLFVPDEIAVGGSQHDATTIDPTWVRILCAFLNLLSLSSPSSSVFIKCHLYSDALLPVLADTTLKWQCIYLKEVVHCEESLATYTCNAASTLFIISCNFDDDGEALCNALSSSTMIVNVKELHVIGEQVGDDETVVGISGANLCRVARRAKVRSYFFLHFAYTDELTQSICSNEYIEEVCFQPGVAMAFEDVLRMIDTKRIAKIQACDCEMDLADTETLEALERHLAASKSVHLLSMPSVEGSDAWKRRVVPILETNKIWYDSQINFIERTAKQSNFMTLCIEAIRNHAELCNNTNFLYFMLRNSQLHRD